MNILNIEELKTLIADRSEWCISVLMPTHRRGRETEQDPIRFRNLLREVEERLQEKGMRTPDIRKLLEPAQKLLQDPVLWRHQSDGLALFISAEKNRYYQVPVALEERVVISNRFHLKPLLPLLTSDTHFYLLALSQNQVRFLEGTRDTVDEIHLENLPRSMAEAFQFDRGERHLQFHTRTSSGAGQQRAAVFHGHDISDEEKNKILLWFHRVDDELRNLLGDERSPLILAGVEYLFPLYKEANSYPNLLEEGIKGNPDDQKPDELHAQAWAIVQPTLQMQREKAVGQYKQLSGSGQTTSDIKEAVIAAYHGRVDTLIAATGVQIWGTYNPDQNSVTVHPNAEPGDEDLLDLAAVQTIVNGGSVYSIDQKQMPDTAEIAAVFRY